VRADSQWHPAHCQPLAAAGARLRAGSWRRRRLDALPRPRPRLALFDVDETRIGSDSIGSVSVAHSSSTLAADRVGLSALSPVAVGEEAETVETVREPVPSCAAAGMPARAPLAGASPRPQRGATLGSPRPASPAPASEATALTFPTPDLRRGCGRVRASDLSPDLDRRARQGAGRR
jgi:hypothetical protein